MPIEVTVGGALTRFMPDGSVGNSFCVDYTAALSLAELISSLGIPADQRMLAILNGNVVQASVFEQTPMHDGDSIALMPPIAAG